MRIAEHLLHNYINVMFSLIGADVGVSDEDLHWRQEVLLEGGSLAAAAGALYTAWDWLSNASRAECLDRCAYVNCRLLGGVYSADEAIDMELLTLNRNAQHRMTLALATMLQSDHEHLFQMIYCAWDYGYYLLDNHGSDAFAAFAGYRGHKEPPEEMPELIVLLRGASWRCTPQVETYVQKVIANWQDKVPEIVDPILARAEPIPAPERAVKDRHCALPGCQVTGEGLVTGMKKCSRCRMVYYCCPEHQREHWYSQEGHRTSCVKWQSRIESDV